VARTDLRELYTFTIDGVESRDLDDAISVAEEENGLIKLYVHIADVAERVAPGSAADLAARRLGTSVYLPGEVVTMLPEAISFSECSLIPHSDKHTISVEMVINPEGDITESRLYESIINSDQRLSYEEVARALDAKASRGPRAEKWVGAIELAHVAATRLGAARAARGGLTGPRVDSLGVVVTSSGLVRAESDEARVAHDLIEEAMVAANEVVGRELEVIGEGIYRIHETPGPEAVEALSEFARALGVRTVLGGDLSPRALSALERQLQERGVSESLWEALIGELGRAAYVPEPGYHFGLASSVYTHFTSPIRRYCDLSVHRILKRALFGDAHELVASSELCAGLNEATQRAAKAERYAQNLIELKWFSERFGVGSETDAKVLRVSKRGALVALADTGLRDWAEPPGKGRVSVSEDEKSCSRGNVTWRVGDSVRVRAGAVDLESGNIALVALR
jgi:ribonuclease R